MVAKTLDDYLATARASDFGERCIEDLRKWKQELVRNGLLHAWMRNYRQYHNGSADLPANAKGWTGDDAFSIQGENGEILGVRVNEARNLVTNALNLTYAKPIGLRAVATNATPEALQAADIANTVLADRFKMASGGKIMRNAGEVGLVIGTGFIDCEWDIFAGEAYLPSDDRTQSYTGAPKMSERWPDEVRYDLTKRRWDDVWSATVIQRANRYILASQIPDYESEILSQPSIGESEFASCRYTDDSSDDILVVKFIHRPVNSRFLPAGRYALVLEDGTVIKDGDSPYSVVGDGRLGIFPITANSGMGSVHGYAPFNDLSPLQQWENLTTTMIATLMASYAAPNITGPSMMQMDIQQLVGGGRYFGTNGKQNGEVKALSLLPDMKPLFELAQVISSFMEKLSGMNSVVRGGAEQEMSGKAVALWKSMAVQFMSSFMQSAIEQSEACGDYLLRLDEAFATGEQIAARIGDDNVQQVVKYRASDAFKYVAKVRAEAVDPIAVTPEGREERARTLMGLGMFTTPQEYMMLVKTGREEPLYKAPMAQLFLIQRENDKLMRGIECKVLKNDKHDVHIPEHEALTADPDVRDDPKLMQFVTEHLAAHEIFKLGGAPMYGVDPQTGQPYPPMLEQLAMAEQQAAMAQQQAEMAAQQQGGQQPSGGGAQQQPARTAQDAMQQSAMAIPEGA